MHHVTKMGLEETTEASISPLWLREYNICTQTQKKM
jgi:hypothetical protein